MGRLVTGILAAALATIPLSAKERLFVLTDISNEPDDEQSLVRLLVYANEYDLEGLVATTSTWLRAGPREDLIRRHLDAYAQVRDHLEKHAAGFPTADALRGITATGQTSYGMADVGEGRASPGSRLLRSAAERDDARPLWVSVWGGANTLAQMLDDARRELSSESLAALIARLRVYSISDQDDSGAWLRREFPDLFYIVSPSTQDWKEYWRATWTGISGDRHFRSGPGYQLDLVLNPWLEANVIRDHGPLGALYPRLEYIMEGDTPAFLGLVDNGLSWALSPAYGGWGGRYALYQPHGETRPVWTNSHDSRDSVTVPLGLCALATGAGAVSPGSATPRPSSASGTLTHVSDQATIWRWREAFQHDFAARMDWCVASPERANHNPVAVVNGDATKRVVELEAQPGTTVTLSAAGSRDPDGDTLTCGWFVYREAGTYPEIVPLVSNDEATLLAVPARAANVAGPQTIHIILEVRDDGEPNLFAYRRIILTIPPQ